MARRGVVLLLVLSFVAIHCGENVANPNSGAFPPPGNLKALSVDRTTVQLQWTAPSGATDSLFKDYLIVWGATQESIPKGALTYTADSLSAGTTIFTLFSRDVNGVAGTGAEIRWAPAERFANAYTIYEARGVLSAGDAAIDCGTDGGLPTTMPMDNNAAGKVDFYCYGGQGQVNNPQVELVSADVYLAGNKVTRFSTVSHASATLDYFLSSFPGSSTFTETRVGASLNTIYYAQLSDANGAMHYARILVNAITGAAPGRSVRLRISLQRSISVPYADAGKPVPEHRQSLALLAPVLP